MEHTELADDRLLPSKAAADVLHVHVDTLKDWRARGTGPEYIKLPGKIVYRESVLISYLDSCTVRPAAATA